MQAECSVVEIDRTLHREHFQTSRGTPWPRNNDGRVVVRTLLRNGAQRGSLFFYPAHTAPT
jgi:hypothetical protein